MLNIRPPTAGLSNTDIMCYIWSTQTFCYNKFDKGAAAAAVDTAHNETCSGRVFTGQ